MVPSQIPFIVKLSSSRLGYTRNTIIWNFNIVATTDQHILGGTPVYDKNNYL